MQDQSDDAGLGESQGAKSQANGQPCVKQGAPDTGQGMNVQQMLSNSMETLEDDGYLACETKYLQVESTRAKSHGPWLLTMAATTSIKSHLSLPPYVLAPQARKATKIMERLASDHVTPSKTEALPP